MKHRLLAVFVVASLGAFWGLSRWVAEAIPGPADSVFPPGGDVETAVFAVG